MVYRQKRFKRQRLVYALPQDKGSYTTRKNDARVKALRSGRRISRTGRKYTETRKNRSDVLGSTYP